MKQCCATSAYHVLSPDGRCVWSCSQGTTPDLSASCGDCVCQPGHVQVGKDSFGRKICEMSSVADVEKELCCGGSNYWVKTPDDRCVWSCGVGTTPDKKTCGECVCKDGFVSSGVDTFGRRVCSKVDDSDSKCAMCEGCDAGFERRGCGGSSEGTCVACEMERTKKMAGAWNARLAAQDLCAESAARVMQGSALLAKRARMRRTGVARNAQDALRVCAPKLRRSVSRQVPPETYELNSKCVPVTECVLGETFKRSPTRHHLIGCARVSQSAQIKNTW